MVDISIVHGSYNFKPTNIDRRHHHIPVISPLYLLYIYIYVVVVLTILKHMKVNGKDDYPIYEMENKTHV